MLNRKMYSKLCEWKKYPSHKPSSVKDSGFEFGFLIRYKGKCAPVEVKATDGNAKSLKP